MIYMSLLLTYFVDLGDSGGVVSTVIIGVHTCPDLQVTWLRIVCCEAADVCITQILQEWRGIEGSGMPPLSSQSLNGDYDRGCYHPIKDC